MFHCQLRRQAAAVLRATDGLEPKPLRFSEGHGGVHRPPQGPGVVNLFSGRAQHCRAEGSKAVASSPSQAHWSPPPPFRRRLRTVRGVLRRDIETEGLHFQPAHGTGPQDSPYQGTLRPHPHRRTPWHDHRHEGGAVHRPNRQAKADCSTGKNAALPSSNPQAMGQRKDPSLLSRKGSISTPGNSRCQVLSARASQCGQLRKVLVGNRTGYPAAQEGSRMVDSRAGMQERLSHLEAHRKRIFTLRLERLRVGSRSKRLRRSQRVSGGCRTSKNTSPSRS